MLQTEALKDELIASDDAFRRLYQQHQNYKRQLESIRLRSLPSQDDEVEIKRIKIEKLRLKDRMELMLRSHVQNLEEGPPN